MRWSINPSILFCVECPYANYYKHLCVFRWTITISVIYINTLCLSIYLRNEILRHHITTTTTTAGHTNTHWCNNHNINSPLLVLRVGGGGEGKVGGNNNCEGIFRTETDMWVNAWTRRATGITINLPTGDWLRWMIIAIGMILKKIEMRRGRVIYFATMMIALQLT